MTLDRRHSSCSFSEVQFFSFICWQMDEDSNTMAMEIPVLRKSINHKSLLCYMYIKAKLKIASVYVKF
jgi:hypothetical protein